MLKIKLLFICKLKIRNIFMLMKILETIQKGESSYVQFKRRIKDSHPISQEMVAFANFKGGTIIIGVDDKTGELNGLSFTEIQKHNDLLANAASNNVKPSLFINTEQQTINNQTIIIANIPEGTNKPYKDKKGTIWIKNGSDKRRVTDNNEIARFLQQSQNVYADEQNISGSSINDININNLKYFILKSNTENFEDIIKNKEKITPFSIREYDIDFFFKRIDFNNTLKKFLNNLRILTGDELSLAGLLLFSYTI